MIPKPLTDTEYAEAIKRLYQFADKTIVPTLRGEEKANRKFEAELAEEQRRQERARTAK
jgi:hypothetical protein